MKRVLLALVLVCLAGCQQQTTLIAFTASWCPACQKDKPVLKQFDACRVLSVDVDRNPRLADRMNVQTLPTYVVEVDENEMFRTHKIHEAINWIKKNSDPQQ